MPAPTLAIFDFDGTLADTFPWFAGVLGEMAAKHGFRAPTRCPQRRPSWGRC